MRWKRAHLLGETRTFFDTTRCWWQSVESGCRTKRRFHRITRDYASVRSLCCEDIGYPGIIYCRINCTRRPRHAYGTRAGLRAFSCRWWCPEKKLSAFVPHLGRRLPRIIVDSTDALMLVNSVNPWDVDFPRLCHAWKIKLRIAFESSKLLLKLLKISTWIYFEI